MFGWSGELSVRSGFYSSVVVDTAIFNESERFIRIVKDP